MIKYGALFFNQGITEELTPYESAVFLKKIKTKPGLIKVIEGNNNAVPLIFIRVLNSSNPSLSGLSEVIYENNAWCVNLIDTIQGNSAEYELYVFVKSSYHISLHPQKWGIQIYHKGVITHASSQRPLNLLEGNNFVLTGNNWNGVDVGFPCAVLITTIGHIGMMDSMGGKTIRVTLCGRGNRIIPHSMIVSGQMSTTSLGKQYFYIDVREYGG
ncbi:hypothetical protein [Proteus terrae]|uniref:hypothetical protein n=1 Tax=Proteus terrae TaxID=1574161 RepID=UPI00301D9719